MSDERRRHTRLARPLGGSWHGASGATSCRIPDVSVSGCFVQSLAMPKVGESTEIAIDLPDGPISVTGEVVYVEAGMGFAVRFVDPSADATTAIQQLIDDAGSA
jgi:hypothetical protein